MDFVGAKLGCVQVALNRDPLAHISTNQILRLGAETNILQTVGGHGNRLSQQADNRAGGVHNLNQPHDLVGNVSHGIRYVVFDRVQPGNIGLDVGHYSQVQTDISLENIQRNRTGFVINAPGLNPD